MPDITIDNLRVAPTLGARVPTKWKAFAQSDFLLDDTNKTAIKASSPYDSGPHYKEGTLTADGAGYVAADFTLPSTTDSPNNPNGARWGLFIFDANNRMMFPVSGLESFRLDHNDLVQTPEDIVAFTLDDLPVLSASDRAISGNLTVGGDATIDGHVTADTFSGDWLGSPSVGTDLTVERDLVVERNVAITGTLTIPSLATNLSGSTGFPVTATGLSNTVIESTGSSWVKFGTDHNSSRIFDFIKDATTVSRIDTDNKWDFMQNVGQATLQWMFGNIIDAVRDYGAKDDGTDTEPQIQDALDAAGTAGGRVVYLPPGNYHIASGLIVPSGVTLMGAGRGLTTIYAITGDLPGKTVSSATVYASIAAVGANRVCIQGLTVDNTVNGTTANGIALYPAGATFGGTPTTYSVIQDCEVLGVDSHQYLIWNFRGQHNKILNNFVDGGVLALDTGSEQEGIESFGGLDVLIQGNTVQKIGAGGINVNAGDAVVTDTWHNGTKVIGNYVENARVGINIHSTDLIENVTVALNHCIGCYDTGITGLVGVGSTLKNFTVSLNTIYDPANEGIRLLGTGATLISGIKIFGNTIEGVTDPSSLTGILLDDFGRITIKGNTIMSTRFAIYAHPDSNVEISDNTIESVEENGILCGTSENVIMLGNLIHGYNLADNNSAGIHMEGVTDGIIKGNTFYTENDALAVNVPSGDRVRVDDVRLLFTSALSSSVSNNATNPGAGIFSPANGLTTFTVTNSLVRIDSRVLVIQSGAPPKPIVTVQSTGSFTVTPTSAFSGSEVYRYWIL